MKKLKIVTFFENKRVKNVVCGIRHSIFRVDNKIFTVGRNKFGQLCLGDKRKRNLPTLAQVNFKGEIFCGRTHSVFLTNSLEVYSGGDNLYGQIGCGNKTNKSKPCKVKLPEKIISISCGANFTIFISIIGNIYATGSNYHGQLCIGKRDGFFHSVLTPVLIPFFKDKEVIQISCGYSHTVFVCSNNKVYSCGYNKSGQLGIGKFSDQSLPVLVVPLEKENIISVNCGGNYTSFRTQKDKIFLVGGNGFGQLGIGNLKIKKDYPFLFSYQKKKIIQVLLLYRTFIFFSQDEAFGCGDSRQLFNGDIGPFICSKIQKICNLKVKRYSSHIIKEKRERFEYLIGGGKNIHFIIDIRGVL